MTPQPCGCHVDVTVEWEEPVSGFDVSQTTITYCPLHAAAPDLLVALELDPFGNYKEWQLKRRAVLAKAKGGKRERCDVHGCPNMAVNVAVGEAGDFWLCAEHSSREGGGET